MKFITISILFIIFFIADIGASETDKNSRPTEQDLEYFKCRMLKLNDLIDANAPRFEDYKIDPEAPVRNPKVDTKSTPTGRKFRTVLRNGISSGANFAGHYAVVVWGCGSSCSTFAIVNLKTGEIVGTSGVSTVIGNYLDSTLEDFLPEGFHGSWGYRYRLDSNLLVLIGIINEVESREGAYYYLLENDELKQIHQTRVIKNCIR